MGCNFYFLKNNKHIGKRSAAGLFCWDCNVTLCTNDKEGVHYEYPFYRECPNCGKPPIEEPLEESAGGIELGFGKMAETRPVGVRSCSSFSWAIDPIELFTSGEMIVDEYHKEYLYSEFIGILKMCPLQFYDSIGQDFS